jgi:hypothetical protein
MAAITIPVARMIAGRLVFTALNQANLAANRHAEAKPIFTLVAYRRAAKFSDNQTKRADNSYEDREHNRDPHGRELELPELIAQSAPTPTDFI